MPILIVACNMMFHIVPSKVVLWQIQPESPLWWLESSEILERTSNDFRFYQYLTQFVLGWNFKSQCICFVVLIVILARSTDCVTEKWVLDSVQFHVVSWKHCLDFAAH